VIAVFRLRDRDSSGICVLVAQSLGGFTQLGLTYKYLPTNRLPIRAQAPSLNLPNLFLCGLGFFAARFSSFRQSARSVSCRPPSLFQLFVSLLAATTDAHHPRPAANHPHVPPPHATIFSANEHAFHGCLRGVSHRYGNDAMASPAATRCQLSGSQKVSGRDADAICSTRAGQCRRRDGDAAFRDRLCSISQARVRRWWIELRTPSCSAASLLVCLEDAEHQSSRYLSGQSAQFLVETGFRSRHVSSATGLPAPYPNPLFEPLPTCG